MTIVKKMALSNPDNSFRFSTKAGTLETLIAISGPDMFCEQEAVERNDWQSNPVRVIDRIVERFRGEDLAVRSSAAGEDQETASMAGAYLSLTFVPANKEHLTRAIHDVFGSYSDASSQDQVLVQPMVRNVALSGVVLTRDLDTGAPYYVVNYDDTTGRTDTVTGGAESKTILIHRSHVKALKSPRIRKLMDCVIEIERVTSSSDLDIEFCVTTEEVVYILQVRPLAARHKWPALAASAIDDAIVNIRMKIEALIARDERVVGETSILAEMTDWNPAEMIGTAPRPLALSLYKTLITDNVWAEARQLMGYKHVVGALLIDLHGRPFIDVRRSLNSFLPDSVDRGLAERLIDHQIGLLALHPDHHDKVEFEVAITCHDLSFSETRRRLETAGFDRDDINAIENHVLSQTRRILETGSATIEELTKNGEALLRADNAPRSKSPLQQISKLLDDCRTLGTLPFAQAARHGFIGTLVLRALVRQGIFSKADQDSFMASIHTVAAEIVADMRTVARHELPREEFLKRYGHLRPGTYDILSWRYDERPELLFGDVDHEAEATFNDFVLSHQQRAAIEVLLDKYAISLNATELLDYISDAIRAREQTKFAFTRALSDALQLIVEWGKAKGITREELSFLTIDNILLDKSEEALKDEVARARVDYSVTRAVRLPHMILHPSDIEIVRLPMGHPTFITSKSVTGPVIELETGEPPNIDGHIVMIEGADPGFDWIFSHNILGLVTMYGGANSHMAVRCAEFGLPAALGCGERLFETLARSSAIELNCAARQVRSR